MQTERVSFYARCGWAAWRGHLAVQNPDGEVRPAPDMGADRVMIFRLLSTPELNLDRELAIKFDGRGW